MQMGVLSENAEGPWMAYWAGFTGFNARKTKGVSRENAKQPVLKQLAKAMRIGVRQT